LTGSRRLWVAQKYHFFRKASEKTKKKEEYREIKYEGPGGRHVSQNEG